MRHTWTVPVSSDGDDGGSVQVELSGCIAEMINNLCNLWLKNPSARFYVIF